MPSAQVPMPRIVVNVSGSATWRRRPVGIVRVERELVKQLRRALGDSLVPVLLPPSGHRFLHLSMQDLDRICADDWVSGKLLDEESPIKGGKPLEARSHDCFISVGSDWSFRIPKLVADVYGDRRVLITMCYDMIPLLFPEFTPEPLFKAQFIEHYSAVAKVGRSVLAISNRSKADLLDFWAHNDLAAIAPPVHVVPLAGLQRVSAPERLSEADQRTFDSLMSDGEFVIFVSTIEPRKNHQMLLDIWREFHHKRPEACPQLLLVGMRGWGSDDLLVQLERMPAARSGKIKWLEGLSDSLLSRLYAGCLFAVFPSVYEGWGLAATEAMDYGKVCLVSDSSSLGEATQHLVPEMGPYDFIAWRSAITRLIDEPLHRLALEAHIRKSWQNRTWNDFGDEVVRLIRAQP